MAIEEPIFGLKGFDPRSAATLAQARRGELDGVRAGAVILAYIKDHLLPNGPVDVMNPEVTHPLYCAAVDALGMTYLDERLPPDFQPPSRR